MMIIGLTGGIGTGKSTVSNYLKKKGIAIIDADQIAHKIVEAGMPALKEIEQAFGNGILNSDGSLNRKALADIVFNDAEEKKRLEDITMKRISEVIKQKVSKLKECKEPAYTEFPAAVIDAPLLFEGGLDILCDEIWVVDADIDIRIKRAAARDNASPDEIAARINSQMADSDYRKKADHILDNSGNIELLYRQIDDLLKGYV